MEDFISCTVERAAELLGCKASTIHTAVRAGELPVCRIGKRILILKEDLHAWVNSRRGLYNEVETK